MVDAQSFFLLLTFEYFSCTVLIIYNVTASPWHVIICNFAKGQTCIWPVLVQVWDSLLVNRLPLDIHC